MNIITPTNIYELLDGLTQVNLFFNNGDGIMSYKPSEENAGDDIYMYNVCSNGPSDNADNIGEIIRQVRVTIYVVGATSDLANKSEHYIDIAFGLIDEGLLQNNCNYINSIDGINIISIVSGFETPIGYTAKNRPIKSKDYIIKFEAR